MYIDLPTIASANSFFIYGATRLDGTYRQVKLPVSPTTLPLYEYATTAKNGFQPLPSGLRFIKVMIASAATDGQRFLVICGDYV
jgi:hypothetical protein